MKAQSSNAPDASRRNCGKPAYTAALITSILLLPLLAVGAGVTSKNAGMAYPDWPTSNAHLINPPGWWQKEDTRWEHGHRLIGWCVGMSAIVLAATTWSAGGAVRVLSLATLAAIIVQGVLGGLRVREVSTFLALIHGIWGQVCFCLAATAALLTLPSWNDLAGAVRGRAAKFFQRLSLAGVFCVFLQLVFGAAYRHFGSRNALIAHLLWVIVVIIVVGWITMWVLEQYSQNTVLRRLGQGLAVTLTLQLLLGGAAFLVVVMGGNWPYLLVWGVPSAHVVVGALMLADLVLLSIAARHVLVTPTALQLDDAAYPLPHGRGSVSSGAGGVHHDRGVQGRVTTTNAGPMNLTVDSAAVGLS